MSKLDRFTEGENLRQVDWEALDREEEIAADRADHDRDSQCDKD